MNLSIAIAQTHTEQDNSPSMTNLTIQAACINSAISDTSLDTVGKADCATSAGFMIGILSTHVSQNFPGSMAAGSIAAHRRRGKRSARALSHRMGGPSKAGSAFPANMSKQGLSARLYASNQTLIMVKAELLQCGGSEVLFTPAARPLRELLSKNHTRIMDFQCPFGSE